MYVCLCNGITDRQICRAVQEGARSIDDLKADLGVATNCARCTDCAEQLIAEVLMNSEQKHQSVVAPALLQRVADIIEAVHV